ncbi:hypothetical protein A2U01_0069823, partial [Trifolium medium]|nr:hypothetical protein [Trifolium medium]
RADLARFDRNDTLADKSLGTVRDGLPKGGKDLVTKDGNYRSERTSVHKSVADQNATTGMKATIGVAIVADSVKGGPGSTEEVRVGDNVIQIGARQATVVNTKS